MDNQTPDTQLETVDVAAPSGEEAVSEPIALSLEEINEMTGKTYKDKDSALKSIKDMSSMAGRVADLQGKREEPKVAKTPEAADDSRFQALETELFLSRNPSHEANLEVLQALASSAGVSLKEATELPAYTALYEKAVGYDENQNKRTIAGSNNRVAQSDSNADELAEAIGDPNKSAEYVMKHFISN